MKDDKAKYLLDNLTTLDEYQTWEEAWEEFSETRDPNDDTPWPLSPKIIELKEKRNGIIKQAFDLLKSAGLISENARISQINFDKLVVRAREIYNERYQNG